MAKDKKEMFQGTGRRKKAIARVRLATGKGNIEINGQKVEDYFHLDSLMYVVKQPLVTTKMEDKLDIIVRVHRWWSIWSSWSCKTWNCKSIS